MRNAGGPETEAHWELLLDSRTVGGLLGEDDAVGLDFLHPGVCLDVNAVVCETRLSKAAQCFVVGVQDMAARLDDMDRHLVTKHARVVSAQILIEHVEQLSCEFHSSGSAA